jgi:putative FmdB family regulatory protein
LFAKFQDSKIHFMPLYEYELCEGDCKVCGGKFTLNRPLSATPLTNCPACRKPVRKIISSFSSPHKLKPVSISDAKKAGFTVLKKISKGEYEKQ